MANSLTINTSLVGDTWEITGSLGTGTLPTEVFLYNNTGTTALGSYVGVCSFNELTRIQVFNNVATPVFGNKYVRSPTLKIIAPLSTNVDSVIATILAAINALSTTYKAKLNTSQVFTIL